MRTIASCRSDCEWDIKAMKNENESVSTMFQNVFVKELVHDSSLICRE